MSLTSYRAAPPRVTKVFGPMSAARYFIAYRFYFHKTSGLLHPASPKSSGMSAARYFTFVCLAFAIQTGLLPRQSAETETTAKRMA